VLLLGGAAMTVDKSIVGGTPRRNMRSMIEQSRGMRNRSVEASRNSIRTSVVEVEGTCDRDGVDGS
jgi:hypothetical protein